MLGIKYFAFAFAMIVVIGLLSSKGDAIASTKMINIVSAVQIECNRRSTSVAGVDIGCRSFADVRKIEMRADNRNRSHDGGRMVQIRN